MTCIISIGEIQSQVSSLGDMIIPRWVKSFVNRFRIVSRAQTGRLMVCMEKQAQMEKDVEFHLGTLSRQFASGALDENDIGNADETHFLIYLALNINGQ